MAWRLLLGARELVGWLGWAFGIYFALLAGWTLLAKNRPPHAQRWMRCVENWNRLRRKSKGWVVANELPIALAFSAIVLGLIVTGGWMYRYPVATYHNVIVLPKNEYGDWPMSSTEDSSLMFRPCPDFNVEPILKKVADEGWIIYEAKWEQRPTCQDIYDPRLGFTINYPDHSYKRRNNAAATAQQIPGSH